MLIFLLHFYVPEQKTFRWNSTLPVTFYIYQNASQRYWEKMLELHVGIADVILEWRRSN